MMQMCYTIENAREGGNHGEQESRTAMLIGTAGVERLRQAGVAVFGLGGVGSYAAEALARAGVGRLLLVDDDLVALSNLNRQLYALRSTIGMPKVQAAWERIRDIDPSIQVDAVCAAIPKRRRMPSPSRNGIM